MCKHAILFKKKTISFKNEQMQKMRSAIFKKLKFSVLCISYLIIKMARKVWLTELNWILILVDFYKYEKWNIANVSRFICIQLNSEYK